MKRFLLYIYKKLILCKNICKWKKQSKQRLMRLDCAKAIEDEIKLKANEKILIVVPHPDDELIACDSIIKKHKNNVVVFYSGMLGGNNSDENRKTRTSEFVKYCENLGVEYIVNNGDVYNGLEDVITSKNFKYIFVPTTVDWHEEHRRLFAFTVGINEKQEKKADIFCYQVTVPIPEKYITHYSKMTKREQKKKWQHFKKVYISQSFMPVERFKIVEGSFVKGKENVICEVFMKLDKKDFNENYVCTVEQKKINDLVSIRMCSEAQYEKAFKIKQKEDRYE